MSQWKPISTMPRDGTRVLLVCMKAIGNDDMVGHMEVDRWYDRFDGPGRFNKPYWPATHWMPLPAPPTKGDQE